MAQVQATPVAFDDPALTDLVGRGLGQTVLKEWSPYLKSKKNGQVVLFTDMFIGRSDLWENCDVQGNTDPAAWRPSFGPVPIVSDGMKATYDRALAQKALAEVEIKITPVEPKPVPMLTPEEIALKVEAARASRGNPSVAQATPEEVVEDYYPEVQEAPFAWG